MIIVICNIIIWYLNEKQRNPISFVLIIIEILNLKSVKAFFLVTPCYLCVELIVYWLFNPFL